MGEMETKNDPPGFMTLLSSAACEWLLIFLMFLDAALSYFLTKLAHYCELPAPCILCARFEHVLGHDKAGNYRNLLCRNHKAEISCLMSCQIHEKLADVHLMCEECFMSIAMQNKSNPESYKLLISKLGLNFEGQTQLVRSLKVKPCSCCNKIWRSKHNVQRLSHQNPQGFEDSKANNVRPPLPRAPFRSRSNRRDNTRTKMRDHIAGPYTSRRVTNNNANNRSINGGDPLSHVGYTELKINSDSESEFQFSEDDDVSIVDHRGRADLVRSQSDPTLTWDKNLQDSDSGTSVFDYVRHNARKCKHNNVRSVEHKSEIHNSEPNPAGKPNSDFLSEISDNSSSTERSKIDKQPISLEAPLGASSEKCAAALLMSLEKDPPNLSKLVFNNKGREILVPSDVSSSSSPKTYIGLQDAIKRSDQATTSPAVTSQRSGSVERSDPGYEYLDGGSVSEVEGESAVDKLKRQVEYDKKCLSSLCKELEEERSASAIAANQAMAMITRLQEEKAALHMESLQYLRMMEEQAEYDMDALEKSNDVIAEKERRIQDLEAELDFIKFNNCDEDNDGVDDDKSYADAEKSPLDSARTASADLQSLVLRFEDGKREEQ